MKFFTKVKIYSLSIVILIVFFNLLLSFSYADETSKLSSKEFMQVNVPAAVVIDSKSGRVLFGKNENERRHMASLTKIMTSILLVENCNMDEEIEVPAEATWIGGSEVGLKKGDKVTARSLLYGMMLPSGNDCAYTVGMHLGGSIENFAIMMNKKAKDMELKDTSFANPHRT